MTVRVPVCLSEGRGYDIHICSGAFTGVGALARSIARSERAVVLSQPPIAARWADPLIQGLRQAGFSDVPVITFPAGERYKTLTTVTRLCDALYSLSPAIDRKTLLIALGGGVVGDVVGFVASIYLRGLDYVQVPTTLLAMVDSSVGGKTGVDFRQGKNLVGAFHQPRAVWAYMDTLNTLPSREFRAGAAEIIKYGVIREPEILEMVRNGGSGLEGRGEGVVANLVERSCRIKADIVSQDEFETTGLRAILNFGHTVGHAIESATRYRRYKHGEAVAMGMMAAAYIGEEQGVTPPGVAQEIAAAAVACRLPTHLPPDISHDMVLELITRDKKAVAGKARFVLACSLGNVALFSDVDEAAVRRGLMRATAPGAGR